jgi:hypothetical protein
MTNSPDALLREFNRRIVQEEAWGKAEGWMLEADTSYQHSEDVSDELELNGLKIFAARLPVGITGISCDVCLGNDPAHPFFVASSIASHRETQENLFDWAFSEGISAICGDSAELHSEIRTTFLRSCFPISKPSEILTLRHTKKGGHTDRYTSAIYRKVRGGTASGRLSKSDAERIEEILRSSEA